MKTDDQSLRPLRVLGTPYLGRGGGHHAEKKKWERNKRNEKKKKKKKKKQPQNLWNSTFISITLPEQSTQEQLYYSLSNK